MNSKEMTKRDCGFKEGEVIKIEGLTELLDRFRKRISVSYSGKSNEFIENTQ